MRPISGASGWLETSSFNKSSSTGPILAYGIAKVCGAI